MAYRRPAIEVIQEFQNAAAALALPSLPACVVGPGYQISDDVNVGVYSELNLSVTGILHYSVAGRAEANGSENRRCRSGSIALEPPTRRSRPEHSHGRR